MHRHPSCRLRIPRYPPRCGSGRCVDAQGAPIGLTANSFNSLSLAPPLVLWSPRESSPSLGAFKPARYFAVNVLAETQVDLSRRFASVNRSLLFKDILVTEDARLMPECLFFQAAARFPHMFATLAPTYLGVAQAATISRCNTCAARCLACQIPCAAWTRPRQGHSHAPLCRALRRHGDCQRHLSAGHPHLWRAIDAEVAAARKPVARFPLRLADVALDRRAVHQQAGAGVLVRVG